jgi:uncharacterized membrane protein
MTKPFRNESLSRFDLRRMDSLSNTIFGIAMTLLAYDIPKPSSVGGVPNLETIIIIYGPRFVAIFLSFAVAGIFWISHHRRLALAPHAGAIAVFGNLLFLLTIIMLPITTGLYGTYGGSVDVIRLYIWHLTTIAAVNALLWYFVVGPNFRVLASPIFSAGIFVTASILAMTYPTSAQVLIYFAFAAPLIGFASRRE